MPFEVLGVKGLVVVPAFRNADCIVLNAGSNFEYELSAEDKALLHTSCRGQEAARE